ncbi:CHAD domain-containing protein [Christiangramia sabulilitoris]|nr:CHAD domain-containing protein [Christiangramia sabulilitoris]
MSYLLNNDQSLKNNITSIAAEEIEGCMEALNNLEIHEAIHDIRKRLKKLRALARLVRHDLSEVHFKEINRYYRDLGREISEIRDLSAHLETIEFLDERYGKFLYANFFKPVTNLLQKERTQLTRVMVKNQFFTEHLPEKLKYAQNDLLNWPLQATDMQVILPGIEKVYKRGKKALEKAYNNPSMENFHEWRKRVKYLWYQTLLLQDSWPEYFETLEAEIHLLADHLGNDHDLILLQHKISSEAFKSIDPQRLELMQALIDRYSQGLRNEAKIKGELIYAETPEDFSKRIGSYIGTKWN